MESGVSRIVDQVVEQKIDSIQSKVEEILYKYLGIEKPIKEEKKNGALEDTALMPIDLEQVSDKTSLDSLDIKEEIEEEIIDDDDFESPAFEPVISESKMENTQNSNLSAISGLTSQDSAENNSGKIDQVASEEGKEVEGEVKAETGLSQISTVTQDNIPELTERAIGTALIVSGISGEEAQMAPSLNDSMEIDGKNKDVDMTTPPVDAQKSQFDLNKDVIEFTGTERKNISLDDSTNSGESEKPLQSQNVPNTAMDIDRYENDTTDSSEMKMEIDLKDESTQETANSSRVENETSSRESAKEKSRKEQNSREVQQSSSHRSSRNHQSSSSSKSKHEKSKNSQKSSSHKKSSSDKERSSSSRRDREKDTKGEASSKSRSKHESDDHHQEKSSRRRRSTDHDSHEGKDGSAKQTSRTEKTEKDESKKTKSEQQQDKLKSTETKATDSEVSSKNDKEQKSSILEKHEYIKSPRKSSKRNSSQDSKNDDDFHGFAEEKTQPPKNPWFDVMDLIKNEKLPKIPSTKKARTKSNKAVDANGGRQLALVVENKSSSFLSLESTSSEHTHEQKSSHSQRYDANELYKPKFDFRRRRTPINEEDVTKDTAPASN